MCKVALAVVVGWAIGATVGVSAKCDVGGVWQVDSDNSCDASTRWLAIVITDCVTEIFLMVMAVWLVSCLQMTLRKMIGVCTAFAWRLGLVPSLRSFGCLLNAAQVSRHGEFALLLVPEGAQLIEYRDRRYKNDHMGASEHLLLALIDHLAFQQSLHQQLRHCSADTNKCIW